MNGDSALRERYESVLERIRAACAAAGRPADSVALLAVGKTVEPARILALASLGQRAFGENYLQEALDKIAACRDERSAPAAAGGAPARPLEWHFIGPIQSNKTRPIAESFDWVHSVEREKIARRLAEQRPAGMPPLKVCIQVNVSGEASKSGCAPGEVEALARAIAGLPGLSLRGLMTIPAPSPDPAEQRAQCARLRALHESVRRSLAPDHPAVAAGFDTLSMGMTDDLEAAILEGATIVRIGTALFGPRPRKGG